MKMYCFGLLGLLFFYSCSNEIKKPSYISFIETTDSVFVTASNTYKSPFHFTYKTDDVSIHDTIILLPKEKRVLFGFSSEHMDTLKFIKSYKFSSYYGNPKLTSYDTLFDYKLPFPKKKEYKILQGNKGSFSHKGRFSSYALDFKMPIGDSICAARSGYVAGIVQHHNKGGKNKSYRDYANYITISHRDGTYSQYVHLKKDGALVSINQYVEQGEVIGLSGNTGWSTKPHLHFAVFKVLPLEFVSIPIWINGKHSTSIKRMDVMSH